MIPALVRRNGSAMAFMAIAVAVAGSCLYALASVTASPYEQLGTAAFPRAVAVLTLAFVVLKAVGLARSRDSDDDRDEDGGAWRRLAGPARMMALTVAYLLALSQTDIDFRIVTSIFLFVATWIMAGRLGMRALIVLLAASIAVSIGLDLLFKNFLYVDL